MGQLLAHGGSAWVLEAGVCTQWLVRVKESGDQRIDGDLAIEIGTSVWSIPYAYDPDDELGFTIFGEKGNYAADESHTIGIVPICYIARPGHPYYETAFGNRQVLVRYRTKPNEPAQLGFGMFVDAERCRAAAAKFVPRKECPPNEHLVGDLKAHAAAM